MNRAPLTNNPAKLPKKLFGKQKIGRSYDFNNQDTINFIEYLYKTDNVQGIRCSK